ncbi:MAG TPA: hypothetical protein VE197_17905, partial [Mycobacterium sp.]|nr:hypothetical protein [Mycobacterium sp.]
CCGAVLFERSRRNIILYRIKNAMAQHSAISAPLVCCQRPTFDVRKGANTIHYVMGVGVLAEPDRRYVIRECAVAEPFSDIGTAKASEDER